MSSGMDGVVVEGSVLAAEGATSSATVLLHPLVVINVSEHFTRIRAQSQTDVASPGACVCVCVRTAAYL